MYAVASTSYMSRDTSSSTGSCRVAARLTALVRPQATPELSRTLALRKPHAASSAASSATSRDHVPCLTTLALFAACDAMHWHAGHGDVGTQPRFICKAPYPGYCVVATKGRLNSVSLSPHKLAIPCLFQFIVTTAGVIESSGLLGHSTLLSSGFGNLEPGLRRRCGVI